MIRTSTLIESASPANVEVSSKIRIDAFEPQSTANPDCPMNQRIHLWTNLSQNLQACKRLEILRSLETFDPAGTGREIQPLKLSDRAPTITSRPSS